MYAIIARWSLLVEAAAKHLLRREVVLSLVVVFVVSLTSGLEAVIWINKVAIVALCSLVILWCLDRYRRGFA